MFMHFQAKLKDVAKFSLSWHFLSDHQKINEAGEKRVNIMMSSFI